MIQAITPANTHSYFQGATAFISQTLCNLVNSIKNVFNRILQSISGFFCSAKKTPKPVQQNITVIPRQNKLGAQPASRRKPQIFLEGLAPVLQPVASSIPKPAPQVEHDSLTPQFLRNAEPQVSGSSCDFVETPVRVASPNADLPSLGSTPLRSVSPELQASLSFDEIASLISKEEGEVPRLLSPVRGFSPNGVPEDEEKRVEPSNTWRIMEKAKKIASERRKKEAELSPRSPRLDQPIPRSKSELAEVFAKSTRLQAPTALVSESIYGSNGVKKMSRGAIYFHHAAIPKIFAAFENGEKVDSKLLDDANGEGLLLFADSKDDAQPIPFCDLVNDLGGFEELGNMKFGELSHLVGMLKGAARNLPADSVLGACILDGDLGESPQIYTAFIRFNSARREHDFYLLDPYGDEQNPVISWHVLNEGQFLSRFAQKKYKVMPFRKMLKDEA